jgi:hypothetical protein
MQRGFFDTHRWPRSLALAMGASLALHGLVLVAQLRLPASIVPRVDLAVNHAVELGIDEARPGAEAPPMPPPTPAIEEPPAPPPPPPPRAARPRAPRPVAPPRAEAPPPENATLEPARDDAATTLDEAAVAALDDAGADVTEESAMAALDDAGIEVTDASAMALADAAVDAGPRGVPGIAGEAGALAAAIPAGSVVTLLLRTDRIRRNPNGPRVSALLRGIRDWRQVLDGTELDPVEDFNMVLIASADPFGTPDDPPDLSVIVRTRGPRGFLRASIEQMAGARAASRGPVELPDGGSDPSGTLRDHFARRDAGALPRPARPVWRRQGGAEVATVDRYMGPHAVVLLGDDLAAIAAPARVPQLLAVLGARTAAATSSERDDTLLAVLQADGLRNLLSLPGRATMIPARAEVALYETRAGGAADGGASLLAVLPYEDDAQPARVAPLLGAFLEDLVDNVDRFAGSLQGRLAEGSGVVHFDTLRSALRAIHARADGNSIRVEATLTADEVAELLNAQRLAQMFR